jgi:hypothetical protein
MATACKPQTPEQVHEQELDAQIEAHARKAHRIIQKARAKMTPEDRKRADENASAILDDASAAAKQARRRA